jgi:hypothetical protein
MILDVFSKIFMLFMVSGSLVPVQVFGISTGAQGTGTPLAAAVRILHVPNGVTVVSISVNTNCPFTDNMGCEVAVSTPGADPAIH